MSTTAVLEPVTTIKTYLRPIDGTGLAAFAAKGKANPASRGTNKVHTVMEGQYRSLSTVGNHAPRPRPARSCCQAWAAASPSA